MSFPYFGHGLASVNSNFHCYIWFCSKPSEAERHAIVKCLNNEGGFGPLISPEDWCGPHLHIFIDYTTFKHFIKYNPDLNSGIPSGWDYLPWQTLDETSRRLVRYEQAFDAALAVLHQLHSIAFVMRARGRATYSPRHTESVTKFDESLSLVVQELERQHEQGLNSAPSLLAKTTSLYEEMLPMRLSKYGGKGLSKQDRQQHLEVLVSQFGQGSDWDLLKVALRLKADKPAAILARMPKKSCKKIWESAKVLQRGGNGAYSAAAFKLPEDALNWLEERCD